MNNFIIMPTFYCIAFLYCGFTEFKNRIVYLHLFYILIIVNMSCAIINQ